MCSDLKYYKRSCNDRIDLEQWCDIYGKRHRVGRPTKIWYDKYGRVSCEEWLLYSQRHREGGPAMLWYDRYGSVRCEEWWLYGELHREGGPARTRYRRDGRLSFWFLTHYTNSRRRHCKLMN